MQKNICVLFEKNIVKKQNMKAAVKRAQLGQHKWIVSFDINSLYPHIIIQYNISQTRKIVINFTWYQCKQND